MVFARQKCVAIGSECSLNEFRFNSSLFGRSQKEQIHLVLTKQVEHRLHSILDLHANTNFRVRLMKRGQDWRQACLQQQKRTPDF